MMTEPTLLCAFVQIAGAWNFKDSDAESFNVEMYYNASARGRGGNRNPLPYKRSVNLLDRAVNAWLSKNYSTRQRPLPCSLVL